jgi:hypothetical protein
MSKDSNWSFDDFKNRPIYKVLTVEFIDETTNGKLLQTIFDNLVTKFTDDYTKDYETVMSLSKPQQAIYLIWQLEAEVNNGGFNQYYFNSSGQFAEVTPDALRLVGATRYANLVERANLIFGRDFREITEHQDGTMDGFMRSYQDNPLNNLDDEFYSLSSTENLRQLQIDFIRKNKLFFVNK